MAPIEHPTDQEVARWFKNRTVDDIGRWQGTVDSCEFYALILWLVDRNEKEK